ncbi:U6 snRNA phosphodiesterase-like [Pyrus ussuriensis x Pyrus communis]|uniref:U6 snRNA phosphodiesterase 1 n=1 Tax=Pyrus ussuriensis x Pyrus communis TaxID=2448454 RepID=A0A5N5F0P7_9ROSA|nr:U6 snRNA phosphodiesterase-like [Pyrus ussuriensis x Pyrus communis]
MMALFLNKLASLVPGLHAVDVDVPLDILRKDEHKLEQVALGREFHISLGRTVPIRVHQIDSLVTWLQRRYWIDFSKWEVFVNDDQTRTFVSIEVIAAGSAEITKQIQAVNDVYKLHNLPEFYKDPRPHISVAWALGDINNSLKKVVEEERRISTIGGSIMYPFNYIVKLREYSAEHWMRRHFFVGVELHVEGIDTSVNAIIHVDGNYFPATKGVGTTLHAASCALLSIVSVSPNLNAPVNPFLTFPSSAITGKPAWMLPLTYQT